MGLLNGLKNLIFGTLFCLTPFTSVIVLGWLMRYMKRVYLVSAGTSGGDLKPTGWIMGSAGQGLISRLFGGLWENFRTGVGGAISLLLMTLPFTLLWLFAWWAGWENSFNKGYEQAWVGPTTGILGVLIGLWVMVHLPIGLAHQAAENRWFALLELRRVRQLVGLAGWRIVWLSFLTVFFALPLFAARGLPVFVENIVPGFKDFNAQQIQQFSNGISVVKAAYVFFALVVLRRSAAAIYAKATTRLAALELSSENADRPKANWFFRSPQLVLAMMVSFGLVVLIFVGQFLNNSWWFWINHPFLALPWLP